jgi:membrane protease YdiL (CAAX protease family)
MFVSILGEELGWRGYLQDALRPLSPAKRFVLIGAFWEFWHFTTRTTHGWSPLRVAVTLLISYSAVIPLSFIIGYATERSRSVMVAVSLHMYLDVLLNNLDLYIPLLLALPIWAWLLLTWPKPTAVTSVASH